MRVKRVALMVLLVGLMLQTGCCRMCRRWCCPEQHYAPAPTACCPPACCPPCGQAGPVSYAPAAYPVAQPYNDCCNNACTTPAPATGVAPAAAPGQWQRAYKPMTCYCQ
ncbi:MAG: hypothetical protein AB7K24_03970 [Gemmataceae bacterium]